MKYDVSKVKRVRSPIAPQRPDSNKERITIRLDADILEYFRDQVDRAGGGNYQTNLNTVLREYIDGKTAAPKIEEIVRRVIREELRDLLKRIFNLFSQAEV